MKSITNHIFFPHAQGYVNHTINPSNNQSEYDYVYQYKDHLEGGALKKCKVYIFSERASLRMARINYIFDTASSSLKVLEENHYYPFGLKHTASLNKRDIVFEKEMQLETSPWIKSISLLGDIRKGVIVPNSGYQYKYNGKEWQDELGLNMYDMDMRQYDPAIGRWVVQDPVVHHSMSPYNAFDNNPVYWADPSGADAVNKFQEEKKSRTFPINTNKQTDWVHNDKTGEYVWDENAKDQASTQAGFTYVGPNLSDVKKHYKNNNPIKSYLGFGPNINYNSYYESKLPLIIQDMFKKYKWYYYLKRRGDNRADYGVISNNSLKRLIKRHTQTVKGVLLLDGIEYNYSATLGPQDFVGIDDIGYWTEHDDKNWTLVTATGGSIKDNQFYLTNEQAGPLYPVISIDFGDSFKEVQRWFLKQSN